MIPIERLALPEELNNRLSALTKEIDATPATDRQAAADTLWKKSGTRTRVHRPLKQALQQMALGLEQCMYCGSDSATDIDHFEPRARNPLRTFEWLNHLLACGSCNSNYKRDRFPTDDDGGPLLIDPTMDDPFQHMTLSLSTDVYSPRSDRGTATIEVCGLNRPQLVDGRRRSRQTIALCLPQWHEAYDAGRDRDMAQIVGTIQQHPFADVCQAMLRQAIAPGAEIIFSDAQVAGLTPKLLVLLRLPELRSALLR
jgi:uncharacterized protein (TIGR02646 family)